MAKVRDRNEDFRDAVRRSALSFGFTELESIEALEHFLMTHKKDYVDLHRTTEQERDSIEHEAVEATKYVELGNKELSQVIQRNSSSRTFLLLFLFVLTFSILFLDWYN